MSCDPRSLSRDLALETEGQVTAVGGVLSEGLVLCPYVGALILSPPPGNQHHMT